MAGTIPDVRRAFAYDSLSYNVSAVVGPALVAIMAAFLPAQATLWILAAAAALGSLAVRAVGLRPHERSGGIVTAFAIGSLWARFMRRPGPRGAVPRWS